jgi:anti-anti-sigma factor
MLEVEIVTSHGTVICVPKGNLEATTVSTFRGAVALCLGERGLIIDLSSVRFIDGAGLTAVVGAIRRAQDHRTRVAVVVPAGTLRNVLKQAGLELIVSLSETADLALTEIHDDDKTAACVHGPGSSDDLVLGVRRVGG